MHLRGLTITLVGFCLLVVCLLPRPAIAQFQPPSERVDLTGTTAYNWTDGPLSIIQLEGQSREAVIVLDDARLTAKNAVLWLTPVKDAILPEQRCQIALIGDARLTQGNITRSGEQLLITTTIRGPIRITVEQRLGRSQEQTDLFRAARALRDETLGIGAVRLGRTPPDLNPALPPTTRHAATMPAPPRVVTTLQLSQFQTVQTTDDRVALIASGGLLIIQSRSDGEYLQLQAQRAVLFTSLRSLRDLEQADILRHVKEQLRSVYLEGDVRIATVPPAGRNLTEQRLSSERAYYDFTTDRAILTDAILLTADTKTSIPVIVRAQTVRQLAAGEFSAKGVQLSSSSFATPSYELAASKAYIKQSDTGDPNVGTRTAFEAEHATARMWGMPLFYWPSASGTVSDRGMPLRHLQLENSNRFGLGVQSTWGLFESFGKTPPKDLDARFKLDYYGDRGPAGGVDADYDGGLVSAITGEPWNFRGQMRSFFVWDSGTDEFGGDRLNVEPSQEFRGRFRWEHQHYLPNDWQVQWRAAWVSDPTFLEEWMEKEFQSNQRQDLMLYVKHQPAGENTALTFLANYNPSNFVTISDLQQEQFEIERLPQFGYYVTGASAADDNLTFYSANTLSRLRFDDSGASLGEQGFGPGLSPGLPSLGTTGTPSGETYRGDFRQEIGMPLTAGQFRVVPYVMGRYTAYSNSVGGGSENRLYGGGGLRMSTAFWKVDDTVESSLWDLHRMRHVVEPYAHVFASASSVDRSKLLIYDEDVDAINDIMGAQIGVRQRWQTKRGGPGRWRSVDVFTLDIQGNFFANQPTDAELAPTNFRGLFFDSLPEASIPRNSVNVDAAWRISDTMTMLADAQYNLDHSTLATAAIGLAVRHQPNISWFIGTRYIEELNSNIATVAVEYQMTPKYSLALGQSYDFGEGESVGTNATLFRRFDRFVGAVRVYYDARSDVSGFSFNFYPENLAPRFATDTLRSAFE